MTTERQNKTRADRTPALQAAYRCLDNLQNHPGDRGFVEGASAYALVSIAASLEELVDLLTPTEGARDDG